MPKAKIKREDSNIFRIVLLRKKSRSFLKEDLLKRMNLSIQYWAIKVAIRQGVAIGARYE